MCFSKAHFSTFKEFQEMYHLLQGWWFKRSLLWWLQISWWLESWCINIRHYYSTVILQRKKLVRGIFSLLTFYPYWNKSKYPMFFAFRGDTGTSKLSAAVNPGLWKQCHGAFTCFSVCSACLWSTASTHLFHSSLFSQIALFQQELS